MSDESKAHTESATPMVEPDDLPPGKLGAVVVGSFVLIIVLCVLVIQLVGWVTRQVQAEQYAVQTTRIHELRAEQRAVLENPSEARVVAGDRWVRPVPIAEAMHLLVSDPSYLAGVPLPEPAPEGSPPGPEETVLEGTGLPATGLIAPPPPEGTGSGGGPN